MRAKKKLVTHKYSALEIINRLALLSEIAEFPTFIHKKHTSCKNQLVTLTENIKITNILNFQGKKRGLIISCHVMTSLSCRPLTM